MRNRNSSRARRCGLTALVTVALMAPTVPANAGIYRWEFYKTYPDSAQCGTAGKQLVQSGTADAYRCTGAPDVSLYLGYTR